MEMKGAIKFFKKISGEKGAMSHHFSPHAYSDQFCGCPLPIQPVTI
jgi:hypothetical protein